MQSFMWSNNRNFTEVNRKFQIFIDLGSGQFSPSFIFISLLAHWRCNLLGIINTLVLIIFIQAPIYIKLK